MLFDCVWKSSHTASSYEDEVQASELIIRKTTSQGEKLHVSKSASEVLPSMTLEGPRARRWE